MKEDPVCKMQVDESCAVTLERDGRTIYFCSEGCRDRFIEEQSRGRSGGNYDLLIIGGGPAGLTAAVYAATMKLSTFLAAGDLGGQAIDSTKIENYMGYDFVTGPELIEKFKDQLIHSHYVDHRLCRVEKLESVDGGFRATASDLTAYTAKAVIVATGMTRRALGVPGEEEFQRRGVFYGHVQDVSFVQGEDAAVIGGGNTAMQIAESLHTVARAIYVVTDRMTADARTLERVESWPNVTTYAGWSVVRFTGGKTLSGVGIRRLASPEEKSLSVRGAFIGIGLQPSSNLASGLADLNDRGEIVIEPDCSTRTPGFFAAGDVTNSFGKRIVIAAGEGAKAALSVKRYLLALRGRSHAR
jgi:alkyl hydroperoxide reductase subunit F